MISWYSALWRQQYDFLIFLIFYHGKVAAITTFFGEGPLPYVLNPDWPQVFYPPTRGLECEVEAGFSRKKTIVCYLVFNKKMMELMIKQKTLT